MTRPLSPLLEQAIRAGAMTRAEAEAADDFAEEMVRRVRAGELTEAEVSELTRAQATADAEQALKRRMS